MHINRPLVPLVFVLLCSGCSNAEEGGIPLNKGIWQIDTTTATPLVDRRSVERLRMQLPPDSQSKVCVQPRFRTEGQVLANFDAEKFGCKLDTMKIEGGEISGKGSCPAMAQKIAGSISSDSGTVRVDKSYLAVTGYYDLDSFKTKSEINIHLVRGSDDRTWLHMESEQDAVRVAPC